MNFITREFIFRCIEVSGHFVGAMLDGAGANEGPAKPVVWPKAKARVKRVYSLIFVDIHAQC